MTSIMPSSAGQSEAIATLAPAPSRETDTQLVSVVIPAFNAQDVIGETLRSVRSQTHCNLEIIVVDDGSTDRTVEVVQAHIAADSRVTLFSQSNQGVAQARNSGWQRAASDLIAFVDADDLWAPTKIERQLEVLAEGGEAIGLVYTWFDIIDEHSRIRFRVRGRKIAGDVLVHSLLGNFIGHGSSALVRRSALIECGGFDSDLRSAGAHGCEDLKLYQRVAQRHQFGLVPEHLTGYRVVTHSMSSDRPRMLRSFLMVAAAAKSLHPELHGQIDKGVRAYQTFLVREAMGFKNYKQAWSMFTAWSKQHPTDWILIPVSIIWSALLWQAGMLAHSVGLRVIPGMHHPFTIGEPAKLSLSPELSSSAKTHADGPI
jgi:glycosyltransferase involved in cell wall biosynthesis